MIDLHVCATSGPNVKLNAYTEILYFTHPIGHVPVININLQHGYENNRR